MLTAIELESKRETENACPVAFGFTFHLYFLVHPFCRCHSLYLWMCEFVDMCSCF